MARTKETKMFPEQQEKMTQEVMASLQPSTYGKDYAQKHSSFFEEVENSDLEVVTENVAATTSNMEDELTNEVQSPPNPQKRISGKQRKATLEEYQPRIVAFLREREHEVYDFRNPERKTDFRWSQISGNWEKMETDEYLDALEHPLVEAEFRSDFDAMRRADICVLVLPCGASAHSEAGWMKGTGKKVIVYQNRSQRPELMYKLFDGIFPTVADVTRFLKEFDRLNNLKTV